MTENPWRDPARKSAAGLGIAAARRRNRVEIDRQGAVYRPQCCGRPFGSWLDASEHILKNECEGEA